MGFTQRRRSADADGEEEFRNDDGSLPMRCLGVSFGRWYCGYAVAISAAVQATTERPERLLRSAEALARLATSFSRV